MAAPKKKEVDQTIQIMEILKNSQEFGLISRTPLIFNRMSQKNKQHLLLPPPPKNKAERASTLKHNPLAEYRDSVYRSLDDTAATRLVFPSPAFKKAMASAALDIPGAAKAQIGRLTSVVGYHVSVFGIPQIFSCVVRNSDPARTPDVRTRAILPRWACKVCIEFIAPLLKVTDVMRLLGAAGIMRGVGDWRTEKGSGDFGQFQIVPATDEAFLDILKTGGRAAQDAALKNPEPYDQETMELLSWFDEEVARRGFKDVKPATAAA